MGNGLFKVYDKENKNYDYDMHKQFLKPVTVYGIKNDKCGYPHFLIYENREWKWVKAERFTPNMIAD